ncbi:MAG: cation:proton antiporter [Saccharolobus sp.]
MNYALLSAILLLTLLLAFLLTRLKISPVIAYLLGGLIAFNYFNFDFNSSYFSILNFLAINLLAFEIGASFDISRAKDLFRRAIGIALVELTLMIIFSYFVGLYLLHLDPYLTLFLVMASIDTSTSMFYKISGKRLEKSESDLLIAVASIEDVEVFFLYSMAIALNGSLNIVKIISVLTGILIATLIIYIFAKYFIKGLSIFTPTNVEDESVIILIPIALVFIFEYISELTQIPTTLTMILAGLAFSSVSGSERILKFIAPIREFSLIFFFLSVGSYLKISISILTFLLLSFLILILKYFSFSTAAWLTGTTFIKSFTAGLYMLPISEFGIIVSLEALQQGINVEVVYYISVVVVLLSSILASILATRTSVIGNILTFAYSRSRILREIDYVTIWFNKNIIRERNPFPNIIFKGFIKMIIYLLLPYILFPIINDFTITLINTSNNIILEYVKYAGELIIALFLLSLFLSEGAKLYSAINNEITSKVIKYKSKIIRKFWLDLTGISSTFYMIIISLIYIIFEIIPLAYNFPSILSLIPVFIGLYLGYRRRNTRDFISAFTKFDNNGISREKIEKISVKTIKKLKKNNSKISKILKRLFTRTTS